MTGLILALQLLTRLPTPRVTVTEQAFAAAIRWFPAAGLIVGAIVAGGGWAGTRIDPWFGALVALALWVGVTGALHLDGLGDIADACGAAHKDRAGDPEKLRAVLADPHVGSFAVVAIGLQLVAKLVLLRLALADGLVAAVVLAPFAARIGPLWWTRCLPSLHQGLAARFREVPLGAAMAVWGLLLAFACWSVPALVVTPLLILGWALWIARRIGGISGDGHGAGIELIESGLLIAAVLGARLP